MPPVVTTLLLNYSAPTGERCIATSLSVCMSVCLSVCEHISGTASPRLQKKSMFLLRQRKTVFSSRIRKKSSHTGNWPSGTCLDGTYAITNDTKARRYRYRTISMSNATIICPRRPLMAIVPSTTCTVQVAVLCCLGRTTHNWWVFDSARIALSRIKRSRDRNPGGRHARSESER